MLANQVVKQLTIGLSIDSSNPLFHLEYKSFVFSWGKMSTTPRLLMSLLLYIFVANKRKSWIIHFFIHFAPVFISLSTSKSLNALDVIAVHICKLMADEKTGNNNLFLRMKPNVFFFSFSLAATRLGNSMSAHPAETCLLANRFFTQNLFAACRKLRFDFIQSLS